MCTGEKDLSKFSITLSFGINLHPGGKQLMHSVLKEYFPKIATIL
jgi:hypothetical protein